MIARVLIVLEQQNLQRQLRKLLTKPDVIVDVPRNRSNLWECIDRETCDLIVIARSFLPMPVSGKFAAYKNVLDAPFLVVIVDREDAEERAQLLAAGCEAVLYAGLSPVELSGVLETILKKRLEFNRQILPLERLPKETKLKDFASSSQVMQEFLALARRVVPSKASLLVMGETGVGKERVARAIHNESPRNRGAFVAVNCGALPESLLESELFGHEEGAFTGATRARRGCFEMGHRGTVFLDEIGEMPFHLQVRLLRVLQEGEVQRVGGEQPIRVDTRVMAATGRNLEEMACAGQFRRDLLYRLSVVTLRVPPLRERREDIPELVRSYVRHFEKSVSHTVSGIGDDALVALMHYDWPGNVRELINVIERAVLLCSGSEIGLSDLPEVFRERRTGLNLLPVSSYNRELDAIFPEVWFQMSLRQARDHLVSQFERNYFASLLRATSGRIDETAKRAGITSRALFDKMQRYQLRKEDFRERKIKHL